MKYGIAVGITLVVLLLLACAIIAAGLMTKEIGAVLFLGSIAAVIGVIVLTEVGVLEGPGEYE